MADERVHQSWRDIILYGQNTATYKFALGRSLLDIARAGQDFATLEDLAIPFSRHMVEHVSRVPRQATTPSNRYVSLCAHFALGNINETELQSATIAFGLRYVIDAFPKVAAQHAPPVTFYVDERKTTRRGLRLTDELLDLAATSAEGLTAEVEARWQLVERAWEARYGTHDRLLIAYEEPTESLVPALLGKRRPFRTSVRPALNGYQRGHCFYCYRTISVLADGEDGSHVDHLLPFVSVVRGANIDVDGVWNLVLACRACNSGKRDRLPATRYLAQLAVRNNWLVQSNHPLRETIIGTTGATPGEREAFLRTAYGAVSEVARRPWEMEGSKPFPFTEHLAG